MYDELVKRLRDWPRVCAQYDGSVDQLHDEAADAIEELSKPRWISVTEQLPEETVTVIVTDGVNVGFSFCVRDYGDLEFYSPWKITHWMPLPEPPEDPAGEGGIKNGCLD